MATLQHCRANLCVASKAQINASANSRSVPAHPYKRRFLVQTKGEMAGVPPSPSRTKTDLGYFLSEEAAARAYDQAAYATYGDFARLNFPRPKLDHDRPLSKITVQTRLNWSLTPMALLSSRQQTGPASFAIQKSFRSLASDLASRKCGRLTIRRRPIHGGTSSCITGFCAAPINAASSIRTQWPEQSPLQSPRRLLPANLFGQAQKRRRNSRFKGVCRTRANRWAAKIIRQRDLHVDRHLRSRRRRGPRLRCRRASRFSAHSLTKIFPTPV